MTYTKPQQERIDQLKWGADTSPYAACIVDCLGFKYQAADGRIRTVKEADVRERFEVRSLQHVRVYGFPVVYANAIAKERM